MVDAAEQADGSRFAARVNAARSRGDSEAWFTHNPSPSGGDPKPAPRIRPDAADIVARNRQAAGSMGRLAGFDGGLGEDTSGSGTQRRLRTAEASRNAQRMVGASGKWNDFEGNSAPGGGITPRAPRIGASEEARVS